MKRNTPIKNINVDKTNYIYLGDMKQEDDVILTLSLLKNGLELDCTGQTGVLGIKRPDNSYVEQRTGISINKNIITINMKKSIFNVPGIIECDLELSDTNGKFTTSSFTLRCKEKILSYDNIMNSNEISGIESVTLELKNKLNELNEYAREIEKEITEKESSIQTIINNIAISSDGLLNNLKNDSDKLLNDIREDYEGLKGSILDENVGANLQNQINEVNNQLATKPSEDDVKEYIQNQINEVNNQLATKPSENDVKEYIQEAIDEINFECSCEGDSNGGGSNLDILEIKSEIIEARTSSKNITYSSLKDRLNALDNEISNIGANLGGGVGSDSDIEYTIINVKENGCKGDGTTNDLPNLKTIFANATSNAIIYFPAGTYLMGNGDSTKTLLTLTGLNNIIIKGDGRDATKLILHKNTPVGIDYGILELKQCINGTIKDLELDGNVQLRHKNHGSLWDDVATNYDNMSNIEISSGENILIENVYSHHPAMDCIFVGRHAGGTTPNGENIIIRNCTLEYGYRQGISIVGWNKGLIQDCIIGETALAENLLNSSVKLGTSPMAGLDSETWSTNYDWIIERTTFNNNYVDINDGSVRFVIKDCILNNSDFYSSTPSCGARTYDITVKNNMMIDSIIDIYNKGFVFEENTIKITSGLKKYNADAQLKFVHDPDNIWYKDGATNVVFRNNVVMVVPDSNGTLTPSTKICYPYLMGDIVMENNVFLDCIFNTFPNDDGSFGVFTNNIFRMTNEVTAYNLNNSKHLVKNNHFIGNFYLGATTRKISSDPSVGVMSFDSNTKKPIWWNGSAWVDATGATT